MEINCNFVLCFIVLFICFCAFFRFHPCRAHTCVGTRQRNKTGFFAAFELTGCPAKFKIAINS